MSGALPERRLSDRSVDRVGDGGHDSAGQRSKAASSAGGTVVHLDGRNSSASIPTPPGRNWTRKRLDALEQSLHPRDLDMLSTVARFRLLSQRQVQALWFDASPSGERAARRALLRLTRLEVFARLERRIGGVRAGSAGHIYRAGPAGQRLVGRRRRVDDEPGLHHLRHTLAVAQLYVDLRISQSAEAVSFEAEPECWRDFLGPHGESVTLKPDAGVVIDDDTHRRLWFVEVDLGTVSTTSLRNKLRVYRAYFQTGIEQERHGAFPRVVWVTPEGRRRRHIVQLLETENEAVGGELHRLLEHEWQPPPTPSD